MKKCKVLNTLTNSKDILDDYTLNWYMCGPTVYDNSHIGHARNYICNDIIRRVLEYFGYKIKLVMNITDVDDKIINKSNEVFQNPNRFLEISKKYEQSFMEDMNNLNIINPDVITRASQYIEEIINFIQKIIENDFGYESNGSVYFDSQSYYKQFADNFKLNLNEESFDQDMISDKKHPQDFALWKAAKENEPFWDSPWGKGRPGWHIECSAMASDIFGDSFDIHSGGCDLKFPHHENEIKQANAKFQKIGWVKYFIHMGHLHIDGLKMSKSLKNFITIKEILKKYNSNQLRMFFLMNKYNQPMNFSEERLNQVSDIFNSFMVLITTFENNEEICHEKYSNYDFNLLNTIDETKLKVDEFLIDDFNTPEAINNLLNLVKLINIYIREKYNIFIVKKAVNLIKKYLFILGINFNNNKDKNTNIILDKFCDFRNEIKKYAFENKQFNLLKLTDNIRDNIMPNLNVIFEDTSKTSSSWRYIQ